MNKIIKLLFISIFLLCASYALATSTVKTNAKATVKAPVSKTANVIIDGTYFPGVSVFAVSDDTFFLSVREAAEIYNATLEWKPVSSVVSMLINNKKIDIKTNSDTVTFGKTAKKMSLPSRLIRGELYVSPEIFTSQEFADIAEMDTTWNEKALILNVINRSNIDSVRYFTSPQNTQVVIHLTEPLPYVISKSTGAIELNIHRGKVQRDFTYANNGAVRDITYETDGRAAIVKVNLQQSPKLVKSMRLKNPDRIAVDIIHSKEIDLTHLADNDIFEKQETESPKQEAKETTAKTPPLVNEVIPTIDFSEDSAEWAKIPVIKFDETSIIDDSYAIIDDTSTITEILPVTKPAAATAKKKELKRKRIIVVDAGHGGQDPGAIGPNGTKEKDINLAIALELKKIFDADDNYEIVLTRKDDTFIPLVERTNIANENNADLFVSLHCNASFNRESNGFEIFFLSEKATDSEAAATATLENSVVELEGKPTKKRAVLQDMLWSMMLNEYINESSEVSSFIAAETPGRLKIPNRGVKQASLYVLRGSQMPAVLVESAFISNYAEEAKLNTKRFQTAAADSIYEGIKKFYARKDKIQNGKK
ncbi:MAG: N-acetylmuramoyl-L-alanine amidase [Endomicrobia bacterium]|nr:N-acetylmuramoyl-L-alanine amidase [Endomicrobiia bacterium]MCL2506794.1 N-acetylmuramoyl-L-alanine amidase [Endomicrobiia bacterium]